MSPLTPASLFDDMFMNFINLKKSAFGLMDFFLMASPVAYGSSPAKERIRAAAATYPVDAATLDPLTHCTELGIKPTLCSDSSRCGWILNPLCHSRNSQITTSIKRKWEPHNQ